jgi:hypothetical protein
MRSETASSRARRAAGVLVALACLAVPSRTAAAQGGLLLQGVTDLELWKTDSASALLARGSGHLAPLFRADIWGAIEPFRNAVLFGELFGEAGSARAEPGGDAYVKQFGLRLSPSDAFSFEVGRLPQIVGAFSSRQLSFRNPLIGTPDGYATMYPYSVRVDGNVGVVDYRAGVVSLPLYRPGYTPDPGEAPRPAIGAGITPTVGLRFGVSATRGAYLNPDMSAASLHGQDWKSYKQSVYATDVQASRGYFEGHAELAYSTYQVPGTADVMGLLFYVEPKYTFTPRFFMAARYERNDYPFIGPVTPTIWVANRVVFNDVEVGGGFRATARALFKLSVRADHWTPNANPFAPHDNGYAVALQWSQTFDVVDLVTRRQ